MTKANIFGQNVYNSGYFEFSDFKITKYAHVRRKTILYSIFTELHDNLFMKTKAFIYCMHGLWHTIISVYN